MTAVAAAAATLLAAPAAKAEWIITPFVDVAVSFTDNVDLAPRGQETADGFVTVAPGVSVRGEGARVVLNFDLSLIRDQYFRSDISGNRGNLLGFGRVELLEDSLFIESDASYGLQTVDRAAGRPATDRVRGRNETEVINYRISPFYRARLGNWADSETRYRFSQVQFDPFRTPTVDVQLRDTSTHEFLQAFTSGRNFSRLRWTAVGLHSETERSGIPSNFTTTRGEITPEYVITRRISLIGSLGYEDIDDPTLGPRADDLSGPFWTVGARWRPGPRTDLAVEGGSRFGGTFWRGNASYIIGPDVVVQANYDESIQVQQTALGNLLAFIGTDPLGNLVDIRTGLPIDATDPEFDLLVDDLFHQRRFAISMVGARGRFNFGVTAFRVTREALPSGLERAVTGTTGSLGYRLTPVSQAVGSIAVSALREDQRANSEELNLGLSYLYDFTDTLSGIGSYAYLARFSGDPNLQLRENVITLRLQKRF